MIKASSLNGFCIHAITADVAALLPDLVRQEARGGCVEEKAKDFRRTAAGAERSVRGRHGMAALG